MEKKTALLIGRYQPFHKGHLEVVKQILNESDELIIGIGSAQYSHTKDNPFTAGERLEMIRAALDAEGISRDRYWIIPIQDINNNSVWAHHIKAICPNFDVIYTRNPLATRLFKEGGIKVKAQPLFDRHIYSGTSIREEMIDSGDWEKFIPLASARVIKKIGGVERLKSIVGDD
jgi:nicotinamide-nucleotide adenylyltransferase